VRALSARPISLFVISAFYRMISQQKFLAYEYHEAHKVNSEKKEFQAPNRRDYIGGHTHPFDKIGKIIERHRRSSNQAEQDDAYDGVKSKPAQQFQLRRYGRLPPLIKVAGRRSS
jgi:hypothetical protein